jgi:biotin carboxyl carrier protein
MRVRLTLEGRTFDVEVGDLDARPIVAMVDGERVEVWPEEEPAGLPVAPPVPAPAPSPGVGEPRRSRRTSSGAPPAAARVGDVVHAPLPGVVESVAVQEGDEVAAGQALCVIEAMKMKNVIRAPRAGTVAQVHVAPGQHVRHNELLLELA